MDCDQLEYQGQVYTRAEIGQMLRDGKVPIPKDDLDTTREFRQMPFTFSKAKIVAGQKFLTVRPGSYQRGTYQEGNARFNVYPMGKMTLGQYLNNTGMKKADFIRDFIGDEEVKYEHIRAFLDDEKPMNIYQIAKSTGLDDIIPEIADQRFQQQYANRMAMLKMLNSQMRDEKDPDKRQELRERRDTLREQAKSLRADETRSFEALLNMMKGDVATATKILDTRSDQKSLEFVKGLTANYATMIMDQFEDVYNNLKDTSDTPGEMSKLDINNFINSVIKMQERIVSQTLALADEEVKKLTGKGVLKVDGLPINAKDINLGATWGYDTRFNNNPIVQSITKIIRDAQVAINLRMVSFRHENNRLVKALKHAATDKSKAFDFMLQTNAKGRTGYMVDRLSSAYWEEYKKASTDTLAKMAFYANNHSFKINQAAQDVRDARNFQYGLDHNNVVYNEGDINSYEDQVRQRAQWHVDKMNPHSFVRLMEKVALQPGRISKEEREFFTNFIDNKGLWSETVDGIKIQPLEVLAHEDWVDPKWEAIQAMPTTDPRRAFYDHMEKHLKEGHQMRRDEQGYIPWNFVPEKYKPLGILSKVQQFAHDNLGQRLSINRDTINPATGEVTKKIPLYMLNDTLSPENKSYDLGNVLEDFMKETWNYDEKRKVEEPVKMLMSLLKAQKVYELNPDGSVKMVDNKEKFKDGLSNNYIQATHRVLATIYGETQEQELVTGTKLFNAAEKADMKMIKDEIAKIDITPQEKQHALQYTSLRLEYTGTNPKIAKYVALSTKYQNIYDNAVNFTGSKAMNSLMFLSSVTYLGINLFAGVGELLQGYSQLFTESAGGRYFNDSQAARAMGYAMANLTPWDNAKKQHFQNIAKFFDTMGDIFHESEGRLKSKTESIAFAQYKVANNMTNTCFTIAMLMHDKVKDKAGVEHSLFDVMKFDKGKASWTRDDIDQELYDQDGRASQYLLSLGHKSDEIMAYNRERKTFMDPIKVDAKMVGRMLGQFKKNWMIANFYYRFGNAKEANLTGGLDNEGFYRTFWREIMTPPKVEDPVTGEMVNAPFNPLTALGRFSKYLMRFSTIGKKLGFGPQEGEYSEMVEANLRKFMREFSLAMTIVTAILVLRSMHGGGDDDWIRVYVLNQLARLQRDVMQFMDPMEFGSIIKNPMPVLSTVTDWYQLMSSTVSMGLLGDPHHKMLSHFTKGVVNMTPYIRQGPAMYNKLHKAIVYGIH